VSLLLRLALKNQAAALFFVVVTRGIVIFVVCVALFAYVPLGWHSETSHLT
jgi:hypothetical protein